MVDPWGALLEGLLEPPEEKAEEGEQPTGAGSAPAKGAAKKR